MSNPVQLLFHGTCYKHSADIEHSGLRPINYDKVYLTADIHVAYHYAKQCGKNNDLSLPVICIVDAPQMSKDGFTFSHETFNGEWTVDYVPAKYLIQIIVESEDELKLLAHYAQEQVCCENS